MKWMLVAVAALGFAGTAQASDASKTYAHALRDAVVPCHTLRYKANLDEQLQRDQARINARFGERTPSPDNSATNAKISQCLADAKSKAADAYKAFAAQTASSDMKQAGKDLLVAYFAYLKVTTDGGDDRNTDEAVAYRKAESNLDVESSIAE
ncbi:hypothetical protein [Frateuria soli]|uniref:hypothetical protein n=1 Tax=Frateuria soli TaxID=1542730 RepID=UPI001E414833|nr:hypothetical protein [Frateuria soli]UGB39130.1 hypothetical protein LQ771_04600 [Frateuria soli]